MRSYCFALLLLAGIFCIAKLPAVEDAYRFQVTEKRYLLSTTFEIDSDDVPCGLVERKAYTLRTCYSLYDHEGNYTAQGICRIFCLGLFYDWGTEIDVYDVKGRKIGLIDGQFGTMAAARFSLYNADNALVGIAFLDQSRAGFTIVDPNKQARTIARLTRQFTRDTTDPWVVKVYDPDVIDPAIVRIFAAFTVDRQESFKDDR